VNDGFNGESLMRSGKTFFGFGRNVFFTGLVSFFMDVSSEMIYPLVPLFLANVLGINMSMIGLIEGFAESTASFLKVFSGWLSDRIRQRKNLMLAGYAISTLSRPMMAMAGVWQQVLSASFIDRLGKGIRTAPRDAIIAESVQSTHLGRAFSFHRAMDTLGRGGRPCYHLCTPWGIQQRLSNNLLAFHGAGGDCGHPDSPLHPGEESAASSPGGAAELIS
jgi:MFS family permease